MSEPFLTRSQLLKARAIAALATPLIRALCWTLIWKGEGVEYFDQIVSAGRQPVMAFWHGRILSATFYFRGRNIVVMTSRNFDGEWIARIIRRFGYGTARGSTSRGGVRALVQMRRDLAAGRPVGFAVDGPRGPARVAQRGAVFLAGATGHPVLPLHIEAERAWTMRSWDRAQIPKPFSRVAVAVGKPIYVASQDPEQLRQGQGLLEQSLGNLENRCLEMLKEEHVG